RGGVISDAQHRGWKEAVLRRRIGRREWIIFNSQRGVTEGTLRRIDRDLRTERRQVGKAIVHDARRHRIIEHSKSASDARLAVASEAVGETGAWSEVLVGAGGAAVRHPRIAGKEESSGSIGEHNGLGARAISGNTEPFHSPFNLIPRRVRFIAQAECKG